MPAATKAPEPSQLERLAAEFPGSALKGRPQGGKTLTYVSIDATINRLSSVLGSNWSTENGSITIAGDGTVFVSLYLVGEVDGVTKRAFGAGADKASDADKAVKTALAEALKKAGHQFGIALYLWDEDARGRAESRMKLDKNRDSESVLKKAVFDLATQQLGAKPSSAAEVAKHFGVPAGALADKAELVKILESAGVL